MTRSTTSIRHQVGIKLGAGPASGTAVEVLYGCTVEVPRPVSRDVALAAAAAKLHTRPHSSRSRADSPRRPPGPSRVASAGATRSRPAPGIVDRTYRTAIQPRILAHCTYTVHQRTLKTARIYRVSATGTANGASVVSIWPHRIAMATFIWMRALWVDPRPMQCRDYAEVHVVPEGLVWTSFGRAGLRLEILPVWADNPLGENDVT